MAKFLDIIARFKGEDIKKGTDKASGEISGFAKNATKLLGAVGAAFSVGVVARFATDSAKLAATARNIELSFQGVAGSAQNATKLLDSMRESARGAISDFDLMKSASRAAFFGVPLERVPDLLRVARTAAIATGQDFNFMLESLVLGIGRASPMIIDNLGLAVKLGTANERMAEKLGKSATAFTEQERKLAILNEVMRQAATQQRALGDAIDDSTNSEKIQSASAAWDNFRVSIGKLADKTLADGLQATADALNNMTADPIGIRGRPSTEIRAEIRDIERRANLPTFDMNRLFRRWADRMIKPLQDELNRRWAATLRSTGPTGPIGLTGPPPPDRLDISLTPEARAFFEMRTEAGRLQGGARLGGRFPGAGLADAGPTERAPAIQLMDDTASAAFEAEMERQAQIVQGFFANAFASAFRDGLNGSVAQNALQFLQQQLTRIAAEAFGRGIEGALSGDFKRNLAGLLS